MSAGKGSKTIAFLDGVRGIACLLVIFYHVNLITKDLHVWQPFPVTEFLTSAVLLQGAIGVTLFLVLSGFLLFLPYAKAILFDGVWPSWRYFYTRRLFRIWPGYFIALFILTIWREPNLFQAENWWKLGLFLIFFMDSTQATFQLINGPFWTLAVEWQFYLWLPWISWVIRKIVGQGSLSQRWLRLALCLGVMMLWGVWTRWWGEYYLWHPDETFLLPRPLLNAVIFVVFGFSGKFMEVFAVGMLVSALYVTAREAATTERMAAVTRWCVEKSFWFWTVGILWLVVMMCWNAAQRHQLFNGTLFVGLGPAYSWLEELGNASGFGLCILALLLGPEWLRRPLEWLPLRLVGLLSYSLYIWHLPFFFLLIDFFGIIKPVPAGYLVYSAFSLYVFVVIIPVATVVYWLIEKPGVRLGEKIVKKR
jgi:peptidoglycan/LPS O-acetylase OafA/YrhL